nr:hypothetical protein BdHM001_35960 [Bdellovibrio sp. HM001]
MKRLKHVFSQEVLSRLERKLDPDLLEQILSTHDATSLGGVSAEDGWFAIYSEFTNPSISEYVQNAIAAGMNVDVDAVNVAHIGGGVINVSCEMCCGSRDVPWPEYALQILESVNSIMSKSELRPAKLMF